MGKLRKRTTRSRRSTRRTSLLLGQETASRPMSTGTKVALAAAAVGVGYLAYKAATSAPSHKIIAAAGPGNQLVLSTKNLPASPAAPKSPFQRAPIIIKAPVNNILVPPGGLGPNDFGDWQTAESILGIANGATSVYKIAKAGPKVAGVDTLPGDMSIRLYDHEQKSRCTVLFSPWKRPGQLTWDGVSIGRKSFSYSPKDLIWSSDPDTIAAARAAGFDKEYGYWGSRNVLLEDVRGFIAAMVISTAGVGAIMPELNAPIISSCTKEEKFFLTRSAMQIRPWNGSLMKKYGPIAADKRDMRSPSKYLGLYPDDPSVLMIRRHGDKFPKALRDKIWAASRYQIDPDRRTPFEEAYKGLSGGFYPNFIMGVADEFGGKMTQFFHVMQAEQTGWEFFLNEVMPFISDVVDAILTVLAVFTAGATLLVKFGLKALQVAVTVVQKVVDITKVVMAWVEKAVAVMMNGLDSVVALGEITVKALLSDLENGRSTGSKGSFAREGGRAWSRDVVPRIMDEHRGNPAVAQAGLLAAYQTFAADQGLKKLKKVSSGGKALYTLENLTMYYATPADMIA